jgi:hypothetical protein
MPALPALLNKPSDKTLKSSCLDFVCIAVFDTAQVTGLVNLIKSLSPGALCAR